MRTDLQDRAEQSIPQASHADAIFLAYEGYWKLQEQGDAITPDEYCARFPDIRSSLGNLLRAHLLVAGEPRALESIPPEAWPEPGDPFLDFEVHADLGRGSFSRVYLATQPALGNRWVAVKICDKPLREARILGQLNHPNIVPINSLQHDETFGLAAICMPYHGSATLQRLLDRVGGLEAPPARAEVILQAAEDRAAPSALKEQLSGPPVEALQHGSYVEGICHLGAQIADALAFIHKRGICHRDLKPSNVLLRPNGQPMLLDFNLSGEADCPDVRMGGTLPYMSPEQVQAWRVSAADAGSNPGGHGKVAENDVTVVTGPAAVDGRADVFSLGVMLYELLAGKHPFGPVPVKIKVTQLHELIRERHARGQLPLREACPGLDGQVAAIIERCLSHDPSRRPAAEEVARALRGRLAVNWRKWLRRRPWVLVSLCCLLLVTGSISAFMATRPQPSPSALLRQAVALAEQRDYDKATEVVNTVLAANPDNLEALFIRGRICQRQAEALPDGDFQFAHAAYQRIDRVKKDGRVKACLGYCAYRMGIRGSEGGESNDPFFRQALALGFDNALLRNDYGELCIKLARYQEAREHLDAALRSNKDFVIALYNRARLSMIEYSRDQQHLQQGIADATRALELSETADLYYVRARLRASAARTQPELAPLALQDLRASIRLGKPAPIKSDVQFNRLPGFADMPTATAGHYTPMPRMVDPLTPTDSPI